MRVNPGVARVAIVGLLLVLSAHAADADWLFAPFVGSAFGGSTALPDLEQGASSAQLIFGGSVGWWSAGILGLEGDFGYAPRFFERDNLAGVFTNSNVITLGGNVVVTLVTPPERREKLLALVSDRCQVFRADRH